MENAEVLPPPFWCRPCPGDPVRDHGFHCLQLNPERVLARQAAKVHGFEPAI
jgi:hypothetical protein